MGKTSDNGRRPRRRRAAVWGSIVALVAITILPMAGYLDFLGKLTFNDVVSTVYDQLTPQLARYYCRHEVDALLADAGLTLTACQTPRGNSYSVAGTPSMTYAQRVSSSRKAA